MKKLMIATLIFLLLTATIGCSKSNEKGENIDLITQEIFTLTHEADIEICVKFDVEKPDVAFENADGIIQNEKSLKCEIGENEMRFYLPNATVGEWKIIYDKKNNSQINVSYKSYLEEVNVKKFTFSTVDKTSMPTTFFIESDINGTCLYRVYAFTADDENADEILLDEGFANLNVDVNKVIDITELANGGYKMRLDIELEYGNEIKFDSQVAEQFILTVKHEMED